MSNRFIVSERNDADFILNYLPIPVFIPIFIYIDFNKIHCKKKQIKQKKFQTLRNIYAIIFTQKQLVLIPMSSQKVCPSETKPELRLYGRYDFCSAH